MRAFLKFLLFLILIVLIVGGAAWFWTGRGEGPGIEIREPGAFVGQTSSLAVMLTSPDSEISRIDMRVEQGGKTFPVYSLEEGAADADSSGRQLVVRPIGRRALPELQSGPARIVVTAARAVLFGLRELESTASRDVQVRLEPPRVEVRSMFHYINHGGSEFVVYRVAPEDVESGVRVGDIEYRGFPAAGAGITGDSGLRVAFFALLYNQALDTRIDIVARDPAGNTAVAPLDSRVFPKPYDRSRIAIDDRFLQRVVPAIASNTPGENIPTDDVLQGFLAINRELRRKNNEYLTSLAGKTAPEMLFKDVFQQLGNSQVEARFADARTYVYMGKNIDSQVHLGFDLAVTANVPIAASQRGVVVHAAYLGIYGNSVVIDHGMGVQSLYAHLSSIDVKPGDTIEKGQTLGRSGMTGLAGGDHLHFTMLVGGQQVTPVDWWSAQWMDDRVLRKIRDN